MVEKNNSVSSNASSRLVVLYNVRFNDGDIAKNLDSKSVIPRKRYMERNLKPLLRVGDEVYAAFPDNSLTTSEHWYPGVIKRVKDHAYGGRYGLIRSYDVK
jgi:hypothetical protein